MGRLGRQILSLDGRWPRRLAVIATLAIFWATAWLPGPAWLLLLIGQALWSLAGSMLILCAIVQPSVRWLYRQSRFPRGGRGVGFLPLGLIVLSIAMVATLFPIRVIAWIYRPDLEMAGRYYYDETSMLYPEPKRFAVGPWIISRVESHPNRIRFHVLGAGVIVYQPGASDEAGMAWPFRRLSPNLELDETIWDWPCSCRCG